jgi:hypothetical protein
MGLATPTIENVIKTIIKLSEIIKMVGRTISEFITTHILPFAQTIKDKFGGTFTAMSDDFFAWGFNLITNFAKGLVQGASTAIVAAINWISSLLTSWFSPGSPPRILPDIDLWGMETINEWLHGFTQADFSILDSLQSSLKTALGAMVNLGIFTDVQGAQMFADLSVGLVQALDEFNRTGQVSEGIFNDLISVGGVFGQELAELLQMQLDLAVATDYAAQAQLDYDAAVKATQVSTKTTSSLIKEYNKMLRGGATKDSLKNQLKLVNLSEIQLDANRKAEIVAKDKVDAANDALKPLQEQVKLQETIISQLAEMVQAQEDIARAAEVEPPQPQEAQG